MRGYILYDSNGEAVEWVSTAKELLLFKNKTGLELQTRSTFMYTSRITSLLRVRQYPSRGLSADVA
jgi:hypothetical protein